MAYKELDHEKLGEFQDFDEHKKVIRIADEKAGLTAFIAVHNINLGPALGGCRMFGYKSEDEATRDVLRLSRGMTYKNAMAGLPLGGGKSVIIGNPYTDKTQEMMRSMGRAIESLGGEYITAEDSGTGEKDMQAIAQETSYVVGLPDGKEGHIGGDPSPMTAYGVYCGMKAAAMRRYGKDSLEGLTVAIQGLGAVGYGLCGLLHKAGVNLVATDVRGEVVSKAKKDFPGIVIVPTNDIFSVEANIFSPCALGAQLNDSTIPQFHFDIIAGAANNQCAASKHHRILADRGILYVPDYVLNAGGVISAAYEYFFRSGNNPFRCELSRDSMVAHVERIGSTLTKVFNIADAKGVTPAQAADEMAEGLFSSNGGASRKSQSSAG